MLDAGPDYYYGKYKKKWSVLKTRCYAQSLLENITRKRQISGVLMQPIIRHPDRMNMHIARNRLVSVTTANDFVS
jgi:hypothetical protein